MKRYMLFTGDHYYPSGGINDLKGMYDTMVEAMDNLGRCDWFHIYDTVKNENLDPSWINYKEWAAEYDEKETV